jgi:Fe-S cluster assembly protein SufB
VDPKLLETYEKLGIPLEEQKMLAGVAVDAVFDSVSVHTSFRGKLAEVGVIFCSFSEAVREHPELVRKYLGSVVPVSDNYYAALNSAVFSDGSFVYIPKGTRCPMELSTYFRINAMNTGQFERTLVIADEGAYVSYLEGCTAPMRDENQLHAAVVELVALDDASIKYSTVQNWYPGDAEGRGGIYNFVTKRGDCRGAAFKDLVDPGRDRLGHHLEIPELRAEGRELGRRVLFGGADQQPAAGRHRHQDDSRGPRHPQHHRFQGHLRRSQAATPTAAWCASRKGAEGARNYTQCDSLLIGSNCAAHTFPYHRMQEPVRGGGARGLHQPRSATTSCSTCAAAAIKQEDAVNMIVNGFCKEVFKELPMEFAVEAQKLLAVSLEGAVG